MSFQMEDINAVKFDGGGYCQNSGSSSSSICSFEEDSAGTFSDGRCPDRMQTTVVGASDTLGGN